MRQLAMTVALLAFVLGGASCGKKKDETASNDKPAATEKTPAENGAEKPATDKPGETPSDKATPAEPEVEIPTEEDYEETALLEVTSENLEAELAKLEKELEE